MGVPTSNNDYRSDERNFTQDLLDRHIVFWFYIYSATSQEKDRWTVQSGVMGLMKWSFRCPRLRFNHNDEFSSTRVKPWSYTFTLPQLHFIFVVLSQVVLNLLALRVSTFYDGRSFRSILPDQSSFLKHFVTATASGSSSPSSSCLHSMPPQPPLLQQRFPQDRLAVLILPSSLPPADS